MIRIKLLVPKLLLSNPKEKFSTQILTLEYDHPITVEHVLKDQKIKTAFLRLILVNGKKSVNRNYLIEESCELKLYMMVDGG